MVERIHTQDWSIGVGGNRWVIRTERQTVDMFCMQVAIFGSRFLPHQWRAETASTTSWTLCSCTGVRIDGIFLRDGFVCCTGVRIDSTFLRDGFLWMPPKSRGKVNPFQRVLGPIEERLDFLDAAIRELHPEYSSRILDRMAYLEDLCRQHVNRVLGVINNKKAELVAKVDKVTKGLSFVVDVLEGKTAKSIKSMEDATQRHHADAKAVRRELGELKSIIDAQSERLVQERRACERLLEDTRELASSLEDDVMHRNEHTSKSNAFYEEQKLDEESPAGNNRRAKAETHRCSPADGRFSQPFQTTIPSIIPCAQ